MERLLECFLFSNCANLARVAVVPAEECSYWLPLYGSMCCRLAAQPHCMTQQMMSGCLKVKVSTCRPNLTHRFIHLSFFSPSVASNPTASLSLPLRSSWAPTPRVGAKCLPFSRGRVFSATTGRKTWRPTSNPPSPSPSTRLVKEA